MHFFLDETHASSLSGILPSPEQLGLTAKDFEAFGMLIAVPSLLMIAIPLFFFWRQHRQRWSHTPPARHLHHRYAEDRRFPDDGGQW